jgi:hypothetical protein
MSIRSLRKMERIRKKVLPHLKKAIGYLNDDSLEKLERELVIAHRNVNREKYYPQEIMYDIASLYNNLGAKYVARKNSEKAFHCFSKSLELKMKFEEKDITRIEHAFDNVFKAALFCCKFEYIQNTIEILRNKYAYEQNFKSALDNSLKIVAKVQNNEPLFFVAGVTAGGPHGSQSIGTPIYFPEAFESIELNLASELTLSDHATLDCSFFMNLKGLDRNTPVAYETDSWKKFCPPELRSKINNATPNLIILLTNGEHIPKNLISIRDGSGHSVEFDFKIILNEFHLPDSYPRFGYSFGNPPEIPLCKSFKYFRGIAGVIEWELKPDEVYSVHLVVKNYAMPSSTDSLFDMKIGILTPFKTTAFYKTLLKHTSRLEIQDVKQKNIQYFQNRDAPGGILLTPEPNSISEKQFAGGSKVEFDSSKKSYNITYGASAIFDDYSILGLSISYRVSPEDLSIALFQWEQPIPTAISHFLTDERFNFPPVCQYVIVNNSPKEVLLKLSTEIEGFTVKQEDCMSIVPYSTKQINHSPLFKREIKHLRETCTANLKTCVMYGNEVIAQRTTRIQLLAFDTMIWEIMNPLTRVNFNIHDFVVAWVTPHDSLVEDIISKAKEFHPARVLLGYAHNLSEDKIEEATYLQCKAIFQALKTIGLSYVDSHISFGWLDKYATQRIKLPFVSIQTKAANCIDGAVLFASLLENIGIQPIVVLVPSHAFVGWRVNRNSQKLILLETTQIATADFKTAIRNGIESLNRGLEIIRKKSNQPNLSVDKAIKRGDIRFIDVSSVREKGVFPQHT